MNMSIPWARLTSTLVKLSLTLARLTLKAGTDENSRIIAARFAPNMAAIRPTVGAVAAVVGSRFCVVRCMQSVLLSVLCSRFCIVGYAFSVVCSRICVVGSVSSFVCTWLSLL